MSRPFNKCREASEWNSPPHMRRGGCAVKKKSRSHLSPRRRGGVDKPNTFCGPTPPRPLHQRWLRSIFLDVASTPPQLRRGVPFGCFATFIEKSAHPEFLDVRRSEVSCLAQNCPISARRRYPPPRAATSASTTPPVRSPTLDG